MSENKAHPQLFKAAMVQAIREARKWMTRRAVTQNNSLIDGTGQGIRSHWKYLDWSRAVIDPGPSPAGNPGPYWKVPCSHLGPEKDLEVWHRIYPRVTVGDALWVKETWRVAMEAYRTYVEYRAGGPPRDADRDKAAELKKISLRFPGAKKARHSDAWKSPLHMPRWATRLVLPVVRVGAERLGDIDWEDAVAEGIVASEESLEDFRNLWESINAERPGLAWKDNPPLWIYEWEKQEGDRP
ncbi:MAG: hypothetical protein GY838_13255 [bacterium]|nr:hypothetical protein [bacterium]